MLPFLKFCLTSLLHDNGGRMTAGRIGARLGGSG
jgi:hypothetical protein